MPTNEGSANAIADYIEGLLIPQGRFQGQPFHLFPWQRRFLRGAFGQPEAAALSLARGGGKTTLIASLGAACVDVDGPLVAEESDSLIVASSFDQGLICFRQIMRLLAPTFERHGVGGKGRFRVQDSANRATIQDRETGAMLRVLGSDYRRLHGVILGGLLIGDELAQWPPGQIHEMLSALETAMGKVDGARALWIGTRPAAADHPFERMLQGAVGYSQIHAAGPDDPPFQRRTWKKANPGLDGLPDLEAAIRRESERAKQDPDRLAQFRALRLNLGVPDTAESLLVDANAWRAAEGEAAHDGGLVVAFDLGTSAAMSAAAGYWPETGALEVVAVFPRIPDLAERGTQDGVGQLYQAMHRRGELVIAGERVSDVKALIQLTLERWGRADLLLADRWREAELREHLEAVGYPFTALETRGMGFHDGGQDVRDFRAAFLGGCVTPSESLLLRSALAEARVVYDPAGNGKLSKNRQGGRRQNARDDAVAATILAVAAGFRRARAAPVSSGFDIIT